MSKAVKTAKRIVDVFCMAATYKEVKLEECCSCATHENYSVLETRHRKRVIKSVVLCRRLGIL